MPFDIAEFQIPAEVTEADPLDYRTFTRCPIRQGASIRARLAGQKEH